jgi:hypothetical protein
MFVAFALTWDTPLWIALIGVAGAFVAPLAGQLLVVAAIDIVLGAINGLHAAK